MCSVHVRKNLKEHFSETSKKSDTIALSCLTPLFSDVYSFIKYPNIPTL